MATTVLTWRRLLERATAHLGDVLEARRLVEEVSGCDAARLALTLDDPAAAGSEEQLAGLVARRRVGEPLQHVLGHWSFRTLELAVDGRALVPRPETEVVAGSALAELTRAAARGDSADELLALDLGTGSGAIACALVAEDPRVRVLAVDVSPAALELAGSNRSRLAPEAAARLELAHGGWYGPLPDRWRGAVDCVVANPPYLAEHEWAGLDPVVRDHDPYGALVAGPTGLEAIAAVLGGAPGVLAPRGAVVIEIAPDQASAAAALASAAGAAEVEVVRDLAGRDRVLVARWERTTERDHRPPPERQ